AFSRVHLTAGETKSITLQIPRGELAVWGANQAWEVEPGEFTASVGGSSEADLSAKFVIK
ncbi:MAG TPA: fibronectin type III-like domain-contianing protein, partial [Verrucomicrobiae bacterium]